MGQLLSRVIIICMRNGIQCGISKPDYKQKMHQISMLFLAIILSAITFSMGIVIDNHDKVEHTRQFALPNFEAGPNSQYHQINKNWMENKQPKRVSNNLLNMDIQSQQQQQDVSQLKYKRENVQNRLLTIINLNDMPMISQNRLKQQIQQQCSYHAQRMFNSAFPSSWQLLNISTLVKQKTATCVINIKISLQCDISINYTLTYKKSLVNQSVVITGQYQSSQDISKIILSRAVNPQLVPYFNSVDTQSRRKLNINDTIIMEAHTCFPYYSFRYKHLYQQYEIKVKLVYDPITDYVAILFNKYSPY